MRLEQVGNATLKPGDEKGNDNTIASDNRSPSASLVERELYWKLDSSWIDDELHEKTKQIQKLTECFAWPSSLKFPRRAD